MEEMFPGLTTHKAISELIMEELELVKEPVDIMRGQIKRGDGKQLAFGSA
jgi:hypothetical protein